VRASIFLHIKSPSRKGPKNQWKNIRFCFPQNHRLLSHTHKRNMIAGTTAVGASIVPMLTTRLLIRTHRVLGARPIATHIFASGHSDLRGESQQTRRHSSCARSNFSVQAPASLLQSYRCSAPFPASSSFSFATQQRTFSSSSRSGRWSPVVACGHLLTVETVFY
jgi:hypothetical protein